MRSTPTPRSRTSTSRRSTQYVFAYGSLVHDLGRRPTREVHQHGWIADLPGVRRVWGVGMDNTREVPGYKIYLDRDGCRPDIAVAFLDLAEDPDASVNGLLSPVTAERLAALDVRERNYRRVDVSAAFPDLDGPVWAFAGRDEARARLTDAIGRGAALVQRSYLERVREGFAALGAAELERYEASTAAPPCPLADLERVDLPG